MKTKEAVKNDVIADEIKKISDQNGGILKPEIIVKEAEQEESPLHPYFCWDDSEAAHAYRIWQARQLIAVVVQYEKHIGKNTRVYVSLSQDRVNEGGGYRVLADVLSDRHLRNELLSDALKELNRFEEAYKDLKELAEVFESIRSVRKKIKI